jgi:hypothetical protein
VKREFWKSAFPVSNRFPGKKIQTARPVKRAELVETKNSFFFAISEMQQKIRILEPCRCFPERKSRLPEVKEIFSPPESYFPEIESVFPEREAVSPRLEKLFPEIEEVLLDF